MIRTLTPATRKIRTTNSPITRFTTPRSGKAFADPLFLFAYKKSNLCPVLLERRLDVHVFGMVLIYRNFAEHHFAAIAARERTNDKVPIKILVT